MKSHQPAQRPSRRRRPAPRPQAGPEGFLPASGPGFLPSMVDRTVIAIPLFQAFEWKDSSNVFDIIIDLNLEFRDGVEAARDVVKKMIADVMRELKAGLSKVPVA